MDLNVEMLHALDTFSIGPIYFMQTLTFVAVRLTLSEAQRERLQLQPVTARRLTASTSTAAKRQTPLSMSPATMRQLLDYISISAQQFQGYIFDVNNEEVRTAALLPFLLRVPSQALLLACAFRDRMHS